MKRILLIAATFLIQACAFTDANLQVNHTESANFKGPILEATALKFSTPVITDNRDDKDRIGWVKNGYGAKTADILTTNAVEDIITNGIQAGLTQNGHSIVENAQVEIQGNIKRFWFDTDVNFWTVEFIGEVQCSIVFINKITGKEIYKSDYSGTYSEKKAGGYVKTWQLVMSKAVDNLVEDIMFDEELVEALEEM